MITEFSRALKKVEKNSLKGLREMLEGVVASRDDASLDIWNSRQVYIALGMMMETASLMGIDNAAMEGFDPKAVDDYFNAV